jgi:hypothetical protein
MILREFVSIIESRLFEYYNTHFAEQFQWVTDRSDDAAVEKMIREARLRERAVGEIEGLKKKGAW